MNLSIGKKITLGFAIALAVLLAIGLVSHSDLQELNEDTFWVTHTVQVQQKISSMLAGILQAESCARGYNLAPDPSLKSLYKDAAVQVNANFQALRGLTPDNPNQQDRLDRLQPLLDMRLSVLQRLIDLRDDAGGGQEAQRVALVTNGEGAMNSIRQLAADMMEEEKGLLAKRQKTASDKAATTLSTIEYGTALAFVLISLGGFLVTRSITYPLRVLGEGAAKIGGGNYAHRVKVASKDEVAELAKLFNRMAEQIERRQDEAMEQDWLKTGLTRFAALFQGQRDPVLVSQLILKELADYLQARHSVLYVPSQNSDRKVLKLQASYAAHNPPAEIQPGEGLIGQSFVDGARIILQQIPPDYIQVNSALGETTPRNLVVQPAIFNGEVKAVLELATLGEYTPVQLTFLGQLAESIGVVLHTIEGTLRTEELLAESQILSENLRLQQAELSEKNVRLLNSEMQLQEQQEELKQTNEEIEQANEELQQSNEEMEEKVNLLAEQKKEMQRANREIEEAR